MKVSKVVYLLCSHGLFEQRLKLRLGGGFGKWDAIVAKLGGKKRPTEEAFCIVCGLLLVALQSQSIGMEQSVQSCAIDSLVPVGGDDAIPHSEAIPFEDGFFGWRWRCCGHHGRTDR